MYLVTGGSGFIGSHLVKRLRAMGEQVRVIDLKPHNDFRVEIADIRSSSVRELFRDCETVFHLAAQVDVQKSLMDPEMDFGVNAFGTLNVLEAARRYSKKFVYASSAAVYGEPVRTPINESHPTKPISPYGQSKLTGEKYALLYRELYGLNSVCLRFFNVFGPGQSPVSPYSGVITKFAFRAAINKPLEVFGSGKQSRDFVFVEDVVDALLAAAGKKKAAGQVMNIGTGKTTTINSLASKVIKLKRKKLKILHGPERVGDIKKSVASISQARKLLGFKPKWSFDKGLAETLKYF